MATIDKTSVRAEIDKIKAEFDTLQKAGKISAEATAIMNSMFLILNLILSIFLEKKTTKNNRNSSLPSSQSNKDDSVPPESGRKNKRKLETNSTANNMRSKESVTLIQVYSCDTCGEDLQQVPPESHERRTQIDIIFEKVVDHMDAEIKKCPSCDRFTKGSFPVDRYGPLQYGNGLKAFVINLATCHMVALSRVQKLVNSMIGKAIAEASILKFIRNLYLVLDDWEQSATRQLLQSSAMNVDETSLRVDKKNYWIHVYSAGEITLKCLHRKRGKEAIEAINIIPRYKGVIIHDCWASYLTYEHCRHGLCGSHLLRELQFVVESNNYCWARHMARLLKRACRIVSAQEKKKLDKKSFQRLQRIYRNILNRGEKELPKILPKPVGKRGKLAKSDAHNLWERLKEYESAVLLFASETYVPFTNNRAERDLRMAKVKQKVSGCFRTLDYAQAYCRISSYVQTMSNKGHNPLIAIQMALAGNIYPD